MKLNKISSTLDSVKLVMFERTMMPESEMKVVNGKKEFIKTGKEVENTTYTFRDSFGDKLIIMSKNNSFRTLEGEVVDLVIEVAYNDFQKKNRVSLVSCSKSVL